MKNNYDEETYNIRLELEKTVLDWPDIIPKKMFGHHCYQSNRKLFAFIEPNSIVITKLSQSERENIPKKYETAYYQTENRNIKHWIRFPIENLDDINNIIPYMKKSYESTYSRK